MPPGGIAAFDGVGDQCLPSGHGVDAPESVEGPFEVQQHVGHMDLFEFAQLGIVQLVDALLPTLDRGPESLMSKSEPRTGRPVDPGGDERGAHRWRKVVIHQSGDVDSGHVRASTLHLERPEAVGGGDVDGPLSGQCLREPVVGDQRAVVVGARRNHTMRQLDRVVPTQLGHPAAQIGTRS